MGLPKPMLVALVPQFYQQRTILMCGDINGDMQEEVTQAILGLNLAGTEPIKLIIDSSGGNISAGRWIADAVACSKAPVHATVVGSAYSMAFLVLQHCQRRQAYPHARLMFHGYTLPALRVDQPDFEELVRRSVGWYAEDLSFVARRTRQPLNTWRRWSREERIVNAPEALTFGIIDEIVRTRPLPGFSRMK